jgi:hypothetical protein
MDYRGDLAMALPTREQWGPMGEYMLSVFLCYHSFDHFPILIFFGYLSTLDTDGHHLLYVECGANMERRIYNIEALS